MSHKSMSHLDTMPLIKDDPFTEATTSTFADAGTDENGNLSRET